MLYKLTLKVDDLLDFHYKTCMETIAEIITEEGLMDLQEAATWCENNSDDGREYYVVADFNKECVSALRSYGYDIKIYVG